MDFLLNYYLFQNLPFDVSENLKQKIISNAVDLVRVLFYIIFGVCNYYIFSFLIGRVKHKIYENIFTIIQVF